MHKPESIFENEMHKILRDFDIQTDHIIPEGKLDLVLINKKKNKRKKKKKKEIYSLLDSAVPSERGNIDKYMDLARELKNHEGEDNANCSWYTQNDPLELSEGTGRIGNQWKNGNHPDYSFTEIN